MKFHLNTTTFLLAFLYGVLSVPVWAAELSDSEKKRFVYDMAASYREKFPEVASITPQEVMEKHAAGTKILFIDTRRPEEIEISTLPGAVTKTHYRASADRYQDHLKIAFCTISYRSGLFSQDMSTQGDQVLNLSGGILAWTLEGGQVFRNDQSVKHLHVFAERWNFAPQGYSVETFSLLDQLF